MSIYQKLLNIQSEIRVPKGQYNDFGKYHYRSCEDILEAAKPLAVKHGCVLIISDRIQHIEGRFYVEAMAQLIDVESGGTFEATAFAREEESKKGMDGAQVTGSSSSYARKYALNGLLALDDVKDSDSTNKGNRQEQAKPKEQPKEQPKETSKQKAQKELFSTVEDGVNRELFSMESVKSWMQSQHGVNSSNELGEKQIKEFKDFIIKKKEEIENLSTVGSEVKC